MARVQLENVKKIYSGNVTAVHDFNLDIKDKEFVVFVGPSGCGKSTTLRMVAGLEEITEGMVKIDGKVVNDLQPKDRQISMVFQNYALYPHLTVFENIAFPLRLMRPRLSNDVIYEKVTRVAEMLGITEYLTRKPKALSGGQRQRVAIGRAIVKDVKVLLMDEPLSNLDAKLRNQMRAEIILLRKAIQTTFIYVTHDQTEAMTLGDRIVIMRDGFIMQVGTPEEVFERPDNVFVAGFIGAPQMNMFPANLVKEGEKYHLETLGANIPVDGEKARELAESGIASREVLLGVRPEHIEYFDKPGPDRIAAEVQVNEMMGSEVHLHVLVHGYGKDGGDLPLVVRIATVGLSKAQRESLVMGQEIYLSFKSKVMHFFDPEKETNLIYGPQRVNALPSDLAVNLGAALPSGVRDAKVGLYPRELVFSLDAKEGYLPVTVVKKDLLVDGYYVTVSTGAIDDPSKFIRVYLDPSSVTDDEVTAIAEEVPAYIAIKEGLVLDRKETYEGETLVFAKAE